MIINHLDKLFVTSDAATILRELEVEHPAAKMLVFASHQQEQVLIMLSSYICEIIIYIGFYHLW